MNIRAALNKLLFLSIFLLIALPLAAQTPPGAYGPSVGGGSVTVGAAGTIVGGTGGGTAQAQTLTPSPAITAYNANGQNIYCWLPIAPNSGPGATFNVSGVGAHTVVKIPGELALIANDIGGTSTPSVPACVTYDSVNTVFVLQNPQAGIGALTSTTNYGAAAQAINLYTSGGCTNGPPPSCTGNFWGIQAPASLAASLQYTGNTLDGGGPLMSDGSQHLSISGDANHAPAVVTTGSGTSIGSTSFCSTANCPAGTYVINTYIDITTACTTTGTYIVNLIYTDDQGAKTVPINIQGTGTTPATGSLALSSTANFGQAAQVIRTTGAASLNYSTTATACGTGGPMVGKLYLSALRVQ